MDPAHKQSIGPDPDTTTSLPSTKAPCGTGEYQLFSTTPYGPESVPSVTPRALPETPLNTGAEILGYEVLGVLGRGGMGVVYKARHQQLKRLVALKMILAGAHAGPEELARFRIEAEAVARLQHPGIVQIYEIGTHQELPFLSLEYVGGGSLQQAMTQGLWPVRRAAELTLALVQAIHYAHQQGIVHRDLKPANVLLTADGQPKVSDFGLAKQLDEVGHTHTGQILGTPRYMAPEQAGGLNQQVGPHTDVYALGAILYELLTGRAPFHAASVAETLRLVRVQEPLPPSRLQPNVPHDLETICLKCLQKEPARRYTSAAALADDLQRFLDGRPITARPIGAAERVWRWCRRNPRVAILSAVALVLLLVAVIVSTTAYLVTSAALASETTARNEMQKALSGRTQALDEKTNALRQAEQDKKRAEEATEGQRKATEREREARLAEADLRKEEARQRRLAVERLVRFTVANGARLLEEGDFASALLYFLDALKNDPENEAIHRLRVARLLDAGARPVHMGFHDRAVEHVAFDPSGRLLVSAGKDGWARVWDLERGTELARLRHKAEVRWAAFDRAGKHLATAGSDGMLQVWEARSGKPAAPPLLLRKAGAHTVFSPDGRRVAAAGGDKYGTTEMHSSSTTIPGPMRQQIIPQGPGKPPLIIMLPGPPIVLPQTTTRNPHGVARVWNVADGSDQCTVSISGWLNRVAFSPSGDSFATAGGHGTTGVSARGEARIWSTVTGKPLTPPLEHPAEVTTVVFSPDGRRLLTACGQAVSGRGEARLWDAKTGQLVGRPMEHALQVVEARFSSDGHFVVTASNDGTARVWEADTGEPRTAPLRHGDRLTAAEFSPDGRRLLTASRDGTVRLWDAESGDRVGLTLHHGEPVTTAAFAPDGRRVATATLRGVVRVWDLATPPPRLHVQQRAIVLGVAFSADGRHLLAAPGLRGSRTLTGPGLAIAREYHRVTHLAVWDAHSGEAVGPPLSHEGPLNAASLSPDGQLLLTFRAADGFRSSQPVRRWRVADGKPEGKPFIHPHVLAAGFASDGRPLAISLISKGKEHTVQVWDCARNVALGPPLAHPAAVEHTALSADGRTLVTADRDHQVRIWEVENGRLLRPALRSPHPVQHLELSSDRSRLLTLGEGLDLSRVEEGLALLWDVKEGRALPLRHGDHVAQAVFSADGKRVATASADGTARIWDAVDGKPLTPPLRHMAGLTSAVFSPDGRMLATAGQDRTARLWDARTGETLGPPLLHGATVTAVAFDADGRRLATACLDGGVRVWVLSREDRKPAQLLALAELLAGRRLDDRGGLVALEAPALRTAWEEGRRALAGDLTVSAERAQTWHSSEAREAQRKRQWPGVIFHVSKEIDADLRQHRLYVRRAEAQAELGRWAEAAADFARAIERGDRDSATLRKLALSRLAAGQRDGYRQACAELRKRLDQARESEDIYDLVAPLVIGADAVDDYAGLLKRTAQLDGPLQKWSGWDLHAAVLLRAGKSTEAAERLTKRIKEKPGTQTPWSWLLLALSRKGQGQTDMAAEWLQKVAASMDPEPPGTLRRARTLPWERLSWEERLELLLLRQEAEAALRRVPAPPVPREGR